jgi:hypothetical protein
MNAGQILVIALSIVLALWLVGGIWYNRRRARAIRDWLQPGLEVFGGRAGDVYIASSGAGLRIPVSNPRAPFRRLDILLSLESRENLPLWLYEHVQGKRDRLFVRGWLRSPMQGEMQVVPAGSPLAEALRTQTDPTWEVFDLSPSWLVFHRGELPDQKLQALDAITAAYGEYLRRISLRSSGPHLYAEFVVLGLQQHASRQLLDQLRALATT